MKRPCLRLVLAVLALALAAPGCASGGIEEVQKQLEGKEPSTGSRAALDVKPPPRPSSSLTGRVGVIVATSSETWEQLLTTPGEQGVAVLFVQPDGPAEKAGIKRGDVITKIDGKPSTNADRAVFLLRARPGEKRTLQVASKDGQRNVTVEAKVPGDVNLRDLYEPLIRRNPNDPVAYFLRAQPPALAADALKDVEKAIELAPGFVEAFSLRAERLWDQSGDAGLDANAADQLRDKAFADWDLALRLDPRNTRVLVSRSQALALRGNAARAKRDAERAVGLDETFPRAYYALAVANGWLGRYRQAAKPARTSIELDPYDVRYYRTLAVIFMRLDRRADARRTVDAILPLVPDQATKDWLQGVLEGDPDGRP